jgi:hypothetical protein
MAKTNKKSLRLDSDYTEDVVGFAIESFLSLISFPFYRFSIEPFSRREEPMFGADGRLVGRMKGFKPFYMQFKRPSAYPDYSTSRIVRDRKAITPQALNTSPRTLYFGLRDKQNGQSDYQHNVLFNLRARLIQSRLGDAAYVCPLFLERSAYRFWVHMAGIRRWRRFLSPYPWDLEDVFVDVGGKRILFDRIPTLAEHVSIPPHGLVKNSNHSYSFTERGGEVCFHSPLSLPEGAVSLSSFLKNVSEGFLSNDSVILVEGAQRAIQTLLSSEVGEEGLPRPDGILENQDGIGAWLEWGDFLRREFEIEQFALIRWEE